MLENIRPYPDHADTLLVRFDGESFLVDPSEWSVALARQLARDVGVDPLTEFHWQVIRYLRDYYERLGFMPPAGVMCRRLGMEKSDIKTRKVSTTSGLGILLSGPASSHELETLRPVLGEFVIHAATGV